MEVRNIKVKLTTLHLYMLLTCFFFFSAEDEARITAKNSLEFYAHALSDEKLTDKFDAADKAKLESAVNNNIGWLDNSQKRSKEENEE